jgi:hypothetical protein
VPFEYRFRDATSTRYGNTENTPIPASISATTPSVVGVAAGHARAADPRVAGDGSEALQVFNAAGGLSPAAGAQASRSIHASIDQGEHASRQHCM